MYSYVFWGNSINDLTDLPHMASTAATANGGKSAEVSCPTEAIISKASKNLEVPMINQKRSWLQDLGHCNEQRILPQPQQRVLQRPPLSRARWSTWYESSDGGGLNLGLLASQPPFRDFLKKLHGYTFTLWRSLANMLFWGPMGNTFLGRKSGVNLICNLAKFKVK